MLDYSHIIDETEDSLNVRSLGHCLLVNFLRFFEENIDVRYKKRRFELGILVDHRNRD